jgi:hypothetical protein
MHSSYKTSTSTLARSGVGWSTTQIHSVQLELTTNNQYGLLRLMPRYLQAQTAAQNVSNNLVTTPVITRD